MDPFRNGTDEKRFRTHIFVFFSTCKRSPFFRYRSVTLFLKKKTKRQKKNKTKKKTHHNTYDKVKQPFDCEVQYKGC